MVIMTEQLHTPVMLAEVLEYLDPKPGKVIVDGTVGLGGHSLEIVKRIAPGGTLIAIDRDKESLAMAQERLKDFSANVEFVYGNFSDIEEISKRLKLERIDGIVLDLGVSTFQLTQAERGFSFTREGPLDMRLDRNSYISAYDLVNNLNEDEISNLLWSFGQERWHNRIARRVVEERQKHPITTTAEAISSCGQSRRVLEDFITGYIRRPVRSRQCVSRSTGNLRRWSRCWPGRYHWWLRAGGSA
jgi:16S rRNA (cytosine1402-N4)-methyltransferase